ncbi:MAG TPA: hypothetical protein VGH99_23870 [Pseudonocardia sp.]
MLKKAGIVLAMATSGLLALSPLAFAGDYEGGHGGHDGGHGNHRGDHDGDHGGHDRDRGDNRGDSVNTQRGLVNVQNVGVQVPVQACNNSILSGVLGVLAKDQRNKDSHDGKCSQDNSN